MKYKAIYQETDEILECDDLKTLYKAVIRGLRWDIKHHNFPDDMQVVFLKCTDGYAIASICAFDNTKLDFESKIYIKGTEVYTLPNI